MVVFRRMNVNSRIMMAIQAAKEIKDYDVVLVGVGLPNLAANFAKKMYSPNLTLVYESGSIDCFPKRQPISIGDPSLAENVMALFPIFDTFSYIISGNRIDVAYLGAAQIDKSGKLNTTVIGDYDFPKVRLPGSGGACEILASSKKSVILIEFSEQKLKREVEFVTSSPKIREMGDEKNNFQDEVVVTDKCVINVINGTPEISAIFEGIDTQGLRGVADKIGLSFSENMKIIKTPSEEDIRALRGMDPSRVYLT